MKELEFEIKCQYYVNLVLAFKTFRIYKALEYKRCIKVAPDLEELIESRRNESLLFFVFSHRIVLLDLL